MIKLHQYPSIWGLPSLSPFCVKVETVLRKYAIPYEVVIEKNPAAGPKGRMPFIVDGSSTVPDSTFIFQYLERTRRMKSNLDPIESAQSLAFQRLIEEDLYYVLLYSRWIDPVGWDVVKRDFKPLFPPFVGVPFLRLLRKQLKNQAIEQGLGMHSQAEVYEIGRRDVGALASFLGSKPFFFGDRFSLLDATAYAFLVTILKQPIESELKAVVLANKNLVSYAMRQESELFSEFVNGPIPERLKSNAKLYRIDSGQYPAH